MQGKIAIIGAGNIGMAIASGLLTSNALSAEHLVLTRRKTEFLKKYKEQGATVISNNQVAVKQAKTLIICVEPQQINSLLDDIRPEVSADKHIVISVVTGVSTRQIAARLKPDVPVIRAMPNTAIAIRESVTCLAGNGVSEKSFRLAREIFGTVGITTVIDEELMSAATALGACGIAFFLRAVRAASQGGIEIGFNAEKALTIAAQTAKGAAALLLKNQQHPEYEIDKVTTPRGVTIAGLNQMEHQGFSSALIKGIVTSAQKAERLYKENGGEQK